MFKIKHSSRNITACGGLNFIHGAIRRSEIKTFIDQQLGHRGMGAKYSRSDIVLSLFSNCLVQGEYIADLQWLKKKFSNQLFTQIPSPDTVEYACKELRTPTEKRTEIPLKGKGIPVHQINYTNDMNKSLIGLAIKAKQLKNSELHYTLGFDNIVAATEKQDAKKSYKGHKGYQPNVSFIGRVPVHIENRNGNTPASFKQEKSLPRCFDNLEAAGIRVESFRGDAASYQKEAVDTVTKYVRHFYIRQENFEGFRAQCGRAQGWGTIRAGTEEKEVVSILYPSLGGDQEYRIVVTRTLRKDGQFDLESGTAYHYYGILTNNKDFTNKEVIAFYNQRGDAENSNRFLLNDFNWRHLPFPDMDANTMYMYLMAMCATLFEWIKDAWHPIKPRLLQRPCE